MTEPRRVALKLDLQWPHKRHTGIFAGAQRYAKEQGWATIIDEFIDESTRYDGVIARATKPLAERAIGQATPMVNVWHNSPALNLLPGVFPDCSTSGHLRAEHRPGPAACARLRHLARLAARLGVGLGRLARAAGHCARHSLHRLHCPAGPGRFRDNS